MTTAYQLPLRTDLPHYSFRCELDGVSYTFEVQWNHRNASWYFSILTAEGVPLITSRRVALGTLLNSYGNDDRLPPGALEAVDTSLQDQDPGFKDLGSRVIILYTPAAAVAQGL